MAETRSQELRQQIGDSAAAVILAAGMGTRMNSALPKVLHTVAGRTMVGHLLARIDELAFEDAVVVVSPETTLVADAVAPIKTAVQSETLGTAHAVLAAEAALGKFSGDVLILFGDTPLLTRPTLEAMLAARHGDDDPAIVVLGFRPDDGTGYGRLIKRGNGSLEGIVEYQDASEGQRAMELCNAGIMAVDGRHLFRLLKDVGKSNAKGEYHLTDIVAIACARGLRCAVVEAEDPDEVMGINTRIDLARAEAVAQRRLRDAAMLAGVTLRDPGTVHINFDTRFGRDVAIGPNVFFGAGVTVGDNVEIRSSCHIDGASIADGAIIGPFARLRPGARIGAEAHIGNFVEIKEAEIERGAKVNHLAYVGDARVGAGANVGAGTITCNYDGFFKSRTDIGPGAFIGSNTALVAPVRIGAGAIIAAGSVITTDVGQDALGIARPSQDERPGWAARYRNQKQASKGAAVSADTVAKRGG